MRTAQTAPAGWLQFIRSVAQDSKLKIVIGNNVGAATDGKTMWLPALPSELTPNDLVLFKGNAFHELGHIRRTNIPFFMAFSKQHGPFAGFLLNALEDVYMEGLEASWKKMAERYLLDSTLVLIERGQFRDGSAGLGEAVACFCLTYLTAKRWHQVGKATDQVEGNLRKHLAQYADQVIPQLRELLDREFPLVRSTEDGGNLALKVIELLKALAEQEQSQSKPQSGGDGDDAEGDSESGQEGEGTQSQESEPKGGDEKDEGAGGSPDKNDAKAGGKPEGSDSNEELNDSEPDAEASSSNGQQSDGSGQPDQSQSAPEGVDGDSDGATQAGSKGGHTGAQGAGEGQQDSQGETSGGQVAANSAMSLQEMVDELLNEQLGNQEVFDKGEALKELAADIRKGVKQEYKSLPVIDDLVIDCTVSAGKADSFVDGMPVVAVDREMANAISSVTSRKANVMGNKLRALLANREENDEYDSRSGRLCERNLHRVAVDDPRIFSKSDDCEEDTAAVSITADLSGSTARVIAEQIRIALTLIENVLNDIGTPREILGFAPKSGELNCLVKSFSDNHRVALDRIAGMHRLVGGNCTPLGAAVLQAGSRLMAHEAQRKLLLVVTDGEPDDINHAVQMTEVVRKSGIDVIYLVIGPVSACSWLDRAKVKFAQAEMAEGIIPAMVNKLAEFLK